MRNKHLKGLLAACLSFSMIVTSFSVNGPGTKSASAAETDDNTVLTEVLTPAKITLRENLPESPSNITEGKSKEVTIEGTTRTAGGLFFCFAHFSVEKFARKTGHMP